MDNLGRQKNTVPQERGTALRQKYEKRILVSIDRRTMQSQTNGLNLSVDTLSKLENQHPKRTKCNLHTHPHLSRRTRGFLKNNANVNCRVALCFASNAHS